MDTLTEYYTAFNGFMNQTAIAQQAAYSKIDPSTLNVFEQLWFSWYSLFSNPIIATGVMAFIMHEVSPLLLAPTPRKGGADPGASQTGRLLWTLRAMDDHRSYTLL